jgi:hypothetical protein
LVAPLCGVRVRLHIVAKDLALFDIERTRRPRQYDTDAEAQITALACTTLQTRRQSWTSIDLERVACQVSRLDKVSRQTVRRTPKKAIQTLVPVDMVHRRLER